MWVFWALACSCLNAVSGALTKRAAESAGAVATTFWSAAFGLPLFLTTLAIVGVPQVERGFVTALVIGVAANIAALTLRNLGLKLSPLSLTVPLLSFTPVFLLGTETIILGDRPGTSGTVGIVLIVLGAYSLNLERMRGGFVRPLRAIVRERGAMLMLIVAAIWSLTSVIDKVCVQKSSAAFYLAVFHVGFVLGYLPLAHFRRPHVLRSAKQHWRLYGVIALLHFASLFAQMIAIQLTLVSYVIAIKRAGMLLSVLIGVLYFGEHGLKQRLVGATLMSVGVALILLS